MPASGTSLKISITEIVPSKRVSLSVACNGIFCFCRLIGLVPVGATKTSDGENIVKLAKTSIAGLVVSMVMVGHAVIGFQDMLGDSFTDAEAYAVKPMMAAFYGTGAFVYFYHNLYHGRLCHIFQLWNKLRLNFEANDVTLLRDTRLIAAIMMSSAILENLANHMRYLETTGSEDFINLFGYNAQNETFLRIFYKVNFAQWEKIVEYNIPMGIFTYISEKLAWYGWNASDAVILVLSRALYGKFRLLYRLGAFATTRPSKNDVLLWQKIAQDDHALWNVMSQMKEFFSPLIFVSIFVSTYFMCMQIHFGLSARSNFTLLDNVYAIWSVAHIWLRVFALCYAGSRVRDSVSNVGHLLRQCPSQAISLDVIRAERYIYWHEMGWTGMGCFTVSKSLLMKIIGTIFTVEMIILQASEETKAKKLGAGIVPCAGNSAKQ